MQEDADNNNEGGVRVDGGNNLQFDFQFDPSLSPTGGSNQSAAGVNLFVTTNQVHDLLYLYGFDEAAGNFQLNNYGNGGIGNDPVYADFQDGSGTNNANFATGPDGNPPRMQMFIWNAANPDRDSALDNSVIIHEYGHGLSVRLTGGPAEANCLWNYEQMSEGWSDFLGLVMTIKPDDSGEMARGYATYLRNQAATSNGIRLAPYSTDREINRYTYADIETFNNDVTRAHEVGFVFGTMLWDMTWLLIDAHGFNPDLTAGWEAGGNNLALQLVIDGMKLQPCRPGFVDARDAILAADEQLTSGANQCLIWESFAGRGLGYSADQGNSDSNTDGRAAYDLPPVCLQFLKVGKSSGVAEIGVNRLLTYTFTITNDTLVKQTGIVLTDTIPSVVSPQLDTVGFSGSVSGNQLTFPPFDLESGASTQRSFTVKVNRWQEQHSVTFFENFENGLSQWSANGLWHLENESTPCGQQATPFPSSDQAAYFATEDCRYIDNSDASLTLREDVSLVGTRPVLRFKSYEISEPGLYDHLYVELSTNGGDDWTRLLDVNDDEGIWLEHELDLSLYKGQRVLIRFRFTSDSSISEFFGWMIDDVYIGPHEVINNVGCATSDQGERACGTDQTRIIGGPSLQLDMTASADPNQCGTSDRINISNLQNEVTLCYHIENLGTVSFNTHSLVDSQIGQILNGEEFNLLPGTSTIISRTVPVLENTVFRATWTAITANQATELTSDSDRAEIRISAAPGSCTSFEGEGEGEGGLPPYVALTRSDPQGRIVVSEDYPFEGTAGLSFDTDCEFCNQDTTQGLVMQVDLTDPKAAELAFAIRPHNEQPDMEDGLFISNDGGATYHKIYDFLNLPQNRYSEIRLNLLELAADFEPTDGMLLKFQGKGRYPIPEAGYTLDSICLKPLDDDVSLSHTVVPADSECPAAGNGPNEIRLLPGEEVNHCYHITNNTLISFEEYRLTDSQLGTLIINPPNPLQPKQEILYERVDQPAETATHQSSLQLSASFGETTRSETVQTIKIKPLTGSACFDFENQSLPDHFRTQGDSNGGIEVINASDGIGRLLFKQTCTNCQTTQVLELFGDFEGIESAELSFLLKEKGADLSLEYLDMSGNVIERFGPFSSDEEGEEDEYEEIAVSLDFNRLNKLISNRAEAPYSMLRFVGVLESRADWALIDDLCIEIPEAVNLQTGPVGPGKGEPGTMIEYPVMIKNGGNKTLTYSLSISQTTGWQIDLPFETITLVPGEEATFAVTIQAPNDIQIGEPIAGYIEAVAISNPNIIDQLTLRPIILKGYDLSVTPSLSELSGVPGDDVTHVINVTNSGARPDRYKLIVESSKWETTVNVTEFELDPGLSKELQIGVTIPQGALSNDTDEIKIIIRSQNNQGSIIQGVSTLRTGSALAFTFGGSTEEGVSVEEKVTAGDWTPVEIKLVNTGQIRETFAISAKIADETLIDAGWAYELKQTKITLDPGETGSITLRIFAPAGNLNSEQFQIDVISHPTRSPSDQQVITVTGNFIPERSFLPLIGRRE